MKATSSLTRHIVGLTALLVISPVGAEEKKDVVQLSATRRSQVEKTYGKLPLSFEANQGQVDSQVKFISRGKGYSLFLTSTEAVLALTKPLSEASANSPLSSTLPSKQSEKPMQSVVRMTLVEANPEPAMRGLEELTGKANYFIENDPKKWRTNIPTYGKVRYHDVYPGVDLIYYGNQRQLEYDFVVSPGADPKTIKLAFEGANTLRVNPEGDLILETEAGELRLHKPLVYQMVEGVRKEIPGSYVLNPKSEVVDFQVAAYDTKRPLVIDPILSYSTYVGGSGFDTGLGVAVDSAGNAYVTGSMNGSVFVTKLNATGSALVYSTFIGGGEGRSIAVDSFGNAYVTGVGSVPTTAGAFQTSSGGSQDAFVTKLNATGSALVYSTFLGGIEFERGLGVAVDSSGNAYVTGLTESADFPTTTGAFQTSFSGSQDAFVTKLNATGSALVYSTFLGGIGFDHGFGVAVDSSGNAYVTGFTSSAEFPTTPGAFQTTGGFDAFVTKLNATGSALVYSTYLGGSGSTGGSAIAVDSSGDAYVTGGTDSADFPTTIGAYQTTKRNVSDAFVTKLNATGSALLYSTYLGGGNTNDQGISIAVDSSGNAYVTGLTNSRDFPTTAEAFQTTFGGPDFDAFVTKLNATGSALVYSSYLGGNGFDVGQGIAVDIAGNAYVTGRTRSTNLPTTTGSLQTSSGGSMDAFVAKISMEVPVANAGPDQTADEGMAVTLDGSASTGQNLSFSWEQIAGPSVTLNNGTSSLASFTAAQLPGGFGSQVLTFKLTVSSGGQSSSDTVNVTVKNVNHVPEAHAGADQTVNETSVVMLDGSASFDPDGDAITFQWVQIGGTPVALTGADTSKPTFTAPLIAGGISGMETLTFELTVSDTGLSGTDQVTVFVEQVNHAPLADAGTAQTVHPGTLVTLNGSASNDPDGDSITFQWVQVAGPAVVLNNSTTANPSFVAPPVSGTTDLTFRLAVSDTQLTGEADVVVTVKNGPPLCNLAQAVPSVLWPPNHGMISVTIAGVTDPDDASVAIAVQSVTQDELVNGLGDGDTSPDAVIQGNSVLLRAERSGQGNGRVYVVHFTADDGQGGLCAGSVKVGVPQSMKPGTSAVDDGQLYDSTQP